MAEGYVTKANATGVVKAAATLAQRICRHL